MKLLLTGAAGFIGSHTAHKLLARGHEVVGLDNLNEYYDVTLKQARLARLTVQPGFRFEKLDLADEAGMRELFQREKFARVIHLAAQAGVRYSLQAPHTYVRSNVTGTLNVLEGCRYNDVEHLVYASTSSVYGANTNMPFSVHNIADHPLSLYASTKRANELMAHNYSALFKLPTTGLRFFTVYGPWGRPDMALFMFTRNILEGKPIDVFNHGHHRRDFTYVEDIAEGVIRVCERIALPDPAWRSDAPDPATSSAPYRLYNIGNNQPVQLLRYIEVIEECLGRKAQKNFLPLQLGDVPETFADIDDLVRDVGYRPGTPIEVGVRNFVDWFCEYYGVQALNGTTMASQAPASAASAMQVPLLDLKLQYQPLAPQIEAAIAKVCASQHFILGGAVRELEGAVSAYSQCHHGIGVSSGTDALLLALMALKIGAGDEVITSSFSFFATAGTIVRAGARPLFCDIDPVSFNLSPVAVAEFLAQNCLERGGELINRRTGGRVRALMPVHLYGQVADMAALMPLARRYQLKVIEDAAQAIGAADPYGARACSFGDVGCLSFFPTKNLGAFGDAGMCVTNDAALAEHMEVLRVHGGKPKYFHAFIGGNFRIDELQAAVLNIKLRHLDDWSAGRQRNAAYYDAAFAAAQADPALKTPHALAGARHIYNQYVIRVRERDALRPYLAEHGIGTEIYYPVPLHLQQCFAYLGGKSGDFPHAEQAAAETLALPIFPELREAQLQYVVEQIAAYYRR